MAGMLVQTGALTFILSGYVVVPTISQALVDGRCTLVKVLAVQFDKSLDDHVLASYPVEKEDDCQMKCFRHKFCVSYNLGPVVDNGVRDCEISKSDEFRDPQNMTDRPGYIYRGTENSCSSGPCARNASCIPDFELLDNFQCVCPSGFTGETCAIDVDECQERLDNCHLNASCNNTVGSFECFCNDGFTGNGRFCADLNECEMQVHDCHFNAECINTVGSFNCSCKPGYRGDGVYQCEDIDECQEQTHNCHLAATCNNTVGSFECVCNDGFTGNGQNCTEIIDPCFNNAVGVANPNIIPDRQITASSYFVNDVQPANGRLNGNGWCAGSPSDINDWLQVDLGKTFQVCGVATQGAQGGYGVVTVYKLSYSSDGNTWDDYKDTESGLVWAFHREAISSAVNRHKLPGPVDTRYIRFHPIQQDSWNCLGVEVYSTEMPPTFEEEPMSIVIEEQENVTFTCLAHGVPMPNITWSKENGSLPVERSVETQGSLLLINVSREDSGKYTCNATNSVGSISSSAELSVHSILKFTDLPSWDVFYIFIGDSLTLPCSAESDLEPTLAWIIPYHEGVNISLNNTLYIASAKLRHNGSYICEAQNNLTLLQVYIEVHVHALPTCQDIKLRQENKSSDIMNDTSGIYFIDPDGGDTGKAPFEVFCNMTMNDGRGVTVISHESEARTLVDGFESDGSYSRDVSYTGANLSQIAGLTSVSAGCRQFIKYECYHSKLLKGGAGWWVSRDGTRMGYCGGATPGSGMCACGERQACMSSSEVCNCDAEPLRWLEDSGFLTDKSTLPVNQLRFGDTGTDFEKGYHTLGKLMCHGRSRVQGTGSNVGTVNG